MDADQFADDVLGDVQQTHGYETLDGWRSAWWAAWLAYMRESRAEWSSEVGPLRQKQAEYDRRLEANAEPAYVRNSTLWYRKLNQAVIDFCDLLAVYLDAPDIEAERSAAGALADFIQNTADEQYWRKHFFLYFNTRPQTGSAALAFQEVQSADRWIGCEPDRHAGAALARLRRLSDLGSSEPLDSEEAEWLLFVEVRYTMQCRLANWQTNHLRDTYQYLQPALYCRKIIAIIDAYERIRAALQIGDSAGLEAAERELDAANAMFGGNVMDDGRSVIWQHQLTDAQRAEWERWKAEHGAVEGEFPRT